MPDETNPQTEVIEKQNAEAEAGVAEAVESSISKLIDQINAGTMKLQEVNARPAAPAQPAVQPPLITRESLNKIADEKGVGEALGTFVEGVLLPQMAQNLESDARKARREIERDPQLGALAIKNRAAIDEFRKSRGLSDAYVVQYGYEDILKVVDPSGFVEATKPKTEPTKEKTALGSGAPRGESVQRGPVIPPNSSGKTREDAINAVEVTDAERRALGTYFGMEDPDIKREKFEIADWEKRLEPSGGFQSIGGIPICTLQEVMPRRTNPDGSKGDYIVRVKEEF